MKIINIFKNSMLYDNNKFGKKVKIFSKCFGKMWKNCGLLLVVLVGFDCVVFGFNILVVFYGIRFVFLGY